MDIGYRGLTVRPGLHLISVYQDLQEAMAIVSSILGAGLKQEDMCLVLGSPKHARALDTCLGFQKLDSQELVKCGRLQVLSTREQFLHNGFFMPDNILPMIRQFIRQAGDINQLPARLVIDPVWLMGGRFDCRQALDLESKLHEIVGVPDRQVLAVCMYDMNSLDAEDMIKLLNNHPLAIIDESVRINPYHCEYRGTQNS